MTARMAISRYRRPALRTLAGRLLQALLHILPELIVALALGCLVGRYIASALT